MSLNRSLVSAVGLMFGACSLLPSNATDGSTPTEPDTATPVADASAGAASQNPQPQSEQDRDTKAIIDAVWRDPGFQERVQMSYLRGSEVDPTLTVREADERNEVLLLLNAGNLDDAASRLRSLQDDDATPVFDFMLGNIYLTQENWAGAVTEYVKATAKHPSFRRAWRNLGLAQMRLEQYAAAAQAFTQVVRLGANDAETWGFLATMHARAGDYVAAEAGFRMVATLEPERERWRIALAGALFGQARYAEGAAMLGAMLDKDPNRPELWLRQAKAYAKLGDTEKAAANLEIVDGLGGSTNDSLTLLGTIYYNDRLYGLAVDAYVRAMDLAASGSHEKMLGIANRLAANSAYSESGKLVAAIERVYGPRMQPAERTELHRLRARLAGATGATAEQARILQTIVTENPLDGDALMQLAHYHQQQGQMDQAIFRYEQAARCEPFAADALMLHARLLVDQGRFRDAVPLLQRSLEKSQREYVQQMLDYVQRAANKTTG